MLVANGYTLGDLLGVGGMGRVYAAEDPDHASVAVKLLHESLAGDPGMVARLGEEARVGQRVRHRNVVRVLDHGTTTDGVPFIVMERAAGKPLDVLLECEGPLPLERIRKIASQILAGLEAIHRAGLVHGDMKAGNVIVGEADRVTIIDFGLARPPATRPALVGEHLLSGTPEYMAPELIRGEPITVAADLYAVGVVIYEMLTGTAPFGGGTAAMIFERQLADEVVPPSLRCERMIPPSFEGVILRALAKESDARHHDAAMFATAVERSLPASWTDDARPATRVTCSTDGPTLDWIVPRTRRLLVGTRAHDSEPVRQARGALRDALANGHTDPVVAAYLGLAQALIEDRRLPIAARELEAAIAWFGRPRSEPSALWRILLTLAAVYDGLGHAAKARRAVADALEAAVRAGSAIGQTRARSLARRLAAAGRRSQRSRGTADALEAGARLRANIEK